LLWYSQVMIKDKVWEGTWPTGWDGCSELYKGYTLRKWTSDVTQWKV
jgi:hypothetical protein